MKSLLFLTIFLLLLFTSKTSFCNGQENQRKTPGQKENLNSVNLVSSLETYNVSKELAGEFEKKQTGVTISVEKLTENAPIKDGSVYILGDNPITGSFQWKMVLGREAVVPVINSKNPYLDKILPLGLSSRELRQLLTEEKQNWGTLVKSQELNTIHFYINEGLMTKVAAFARLDPEVINKKIPAVKIDIISAIQNDEYGIGFCKLGDLLNPSKEGFVPGIQILPIDKNGNGTIDYFEKIYNTPQEFTRGVWIGKYPAALCSNIYAVSSSKPDNKSTLDFLTWIQNDGQILLNQNGYSSLAVNERRDNIENLSAPVLAKTDNKTPFRSYWIVVIAALLAIFAAFRLFRPKQKKAVAELSDEVEMIPAVNEKTYNAPKGLYFDKSHTWAFMEKDGTVKVGIDDFLQHATGELTSVTMKEAGKTVRKGDKILTISHNGKKLDIHAPISGTIKERNRSLLFDSTLLNSAPYSDGWVYTIEPKNWLKENHFLFMSEKYLEWLGDEFTRLKDFIAMEFRSNTYELSHIILQDGGEICDNVLADLDPKVWEKFQEKFLDE